MEFLKSPELGHLEHKYEANSDGKKRLPNISEIRTTASIFVEFVNEEQKMQNLHTEVKGLNNFSDCSEEFDQGFKIEVKKNRRKSTTPQRAVQVSFKSEINQIEPMENPCYLPQQGVKDSSNVLESNTALSSQENIGKLVKGEHFGKLFDWESGTILDSLHDNDIFNNLENAVAGKDKDVVSNANEEWKEHWGIKCNMCKQVFSVKNEFDKHYKSNYGPFPVYTCVYCNKFFPKYTTFRSHCYRHKTEERFRCKECNKGFCHQSSLHLHIIAKHTNEKPFMCEECGKNFITKPGLKIHLKKHKTDVKEDYPCVECGKVLHTRGGLTSHMNVHRLGRRFMCDLCGKTFTQKVNMMQHVKQHIGDKPHACDKCGKTFTERSHLARHYSFHSDQRPFKCMVCQKMYKTERCLKVHRLVHAAERPFLCTVCNKGFLSSTKLKQHSNIHTGERPFKCKYCGRTFTNYPNWLKHIKRRHKVDHRTGAELPSLPKSSETEIQLKIDIEAGPKIEPHFETSQEFSVPVSVPAATPLQAVESNESTSSVIPAVPDTIPIVNEHLINDMAFVKGDEMFLQQGFSNFALLEDKLIFNQQNDLFQASSSIASGSNHYFVPYFQATFSNQNGTRSSSPSLMTMPVQLNEFVTTNFVG